MKQMALSLEFDQVVTFDSFYVADKNRETLMSLKSFMGLAGSESCHLKAPNAEQLFYLWGEPGTGKSHLLQAVCHHSGLQGVRVGYLDFRQVAALGPHVLEGFGGFDLLCWDHLEILFDTNKDPSLWGEPLFRLFNELRDQGTKLLVAASARPAELHMELKDLESRLNWGLNYHLRPLTYSEQCGALIFLSEQRGMQLTRGVAEFILKRIGRKMSDLSDLVERLDKDSLSAHRKITIPFVKECFAW